MVVGEFRAGPDHVIVLYAPADLGAELDPVAIMAEIAADAENRAATGLRILSMTSMPLRHAGAFLGQEGSGYQTKAAIGVVYERWAGVTPEAAADETVTAQGGVPESFTA
jgi:hypothetical protein